jgi:simple sugar transport system substrate-binding protein
MRRSTWLVAAAVVPMLVVSACSSRNAVNKPHDKSGGGKGGYGYKIAVVTHGGQGDSFWSIVKNGVTQAGKDMGVTVTYQSDGDPQQQSRLIDAAVNSNPDGLVVSMANPEALRTSIQNAVKKGIPVITINSGEAQSKAYGALTHIGSDETIAGRAVGTQLKTDGVKNVICVIQEAGNVGLEQRCAGVKETLGGTVTNIQVDNNNLQAAQSIIAAKLQSNKSVDGVVTLGAQVAKAAETAISTAGSSAKLATFDLNATVAKDITAGKILFAVDQQPYLQGFMPIVLLAERARYGLFPAQGQVFPTGPSFITAKTATQVQRLSAVGIR